MPTDDERRRVAERLRSLAGGYVTIGEMEDALGICLSSPIVDLERDARDLHRLADLIEPSCDREALLALADKMEEKSEDWDVAQGGIPLVHAGYLPAYARRIREACVATGDE